MLLKFLKSYLFDKARYKKSLKTCLKLKFQFHDFFKTFSTPLKVRFMHSKVLCKVITMNSKSFNFLYVVCTNFYFST